MASLFFIMANSATAEVDLTLRPTEEFARVGEPLIVELVATSTIGADEPIASMSVILTWDADAFVSIEVFPSPDASWLVLGLLTDPDGINTFVDDGDAILTGLAFPSNLIHAPPDGAVIALLRLEGLKRMPFTELSIPSQVGNFGETFVGADPGINKVGQLEGASLPVVECGVPDSDADGSVDLLDVAGFVHCFLGVDAEVEGLCACVFDLDDNGAGDGDVDLADWAALSIQFSAMTD